MAGFKPTEYQCVACKGVFEIDDVAIEQCRDSYPDEDFSPADVANITTLCPECAERDIRG